MADDKMLSTETQIAMLKALREFVVELQDNGAVLLTAADTLVESNGSDSISVAYSQQLRECVEELYKVTTIVDEFVNGLEDEKAKIEDIYNSI